MSNEWNRFADALFDAGSKVGTGVIIGGIRNDAEKTYKTALRNIDNIIKMSPSGQETQEEAAPKEGEMLNQFFDGFNPNAELKDNISTLQPMNLNQTAPLIKPRVTGTPVSNPGEDMLKVFLDASAKLGTFGEYGQPYQDPLSAYYKSKIPEPVKTKTDVSNGYLIKYDEEGNILKKTKIDDLPKQEKNTVMKYSKMTLEEAEQLTDNELSGDAFFYLPKDTQNALMQKYPALQQMHDAKFKEGDFAPKSPGIRRSRGPGKLNIPISDKGSDDNKKFDALAEFNNKINAGSELSMEEEEKYNTLRLDLGKRYNMDDTQLAKVIDRLESSTSENDRKKIINEIEKGEYHEDVGTSQEQMDYDRNRILEWQTALDQSYSANDGSYDGYKKAFLLELQDFYFRGSLTAKEYADLKKMYF